MDVKLKALNPRKALITWSPPAHMGDGVAGYVIEWYGNDGQQHQLTLWKENEFTFRDLQPGQSITAAVRSIPNKYLYKQHGFRGPISSYVQINLPSGNDGWFDIA